MFVGITWGQFGLLILGALILYYSIVIVIYYRAELLGTLRKTSTPADLVPSPATTAVPVYAAIGGTADYGNGFVPSPWPDVPKNQDPESPPAADAFRADTAQAAESNLTAESWADE